MCSPAHSHYHSRPLSTITRPQASDEPRFTRKYSLDHGEWNLPPSTPSPPGKHKDLPTMGDHAQVTNMQTEDRPPGKESACLPTEGDEEDDVNHNGPCAEGATTRTCRRQVLKKQASFESIGCDDNYFYDFFDRNCRPPTPSLPTSDVLRDTSLPPPDSEVSNDLNVENNNEPINTNRLDGNSGASSKLRRNVNSVRPRSWLTGSTARVEDGKRARRRQTDPCGKDFLSNYEKALSSLLYQPYECRSEGPSASTSTFDDSDVGYWLGGASSKKYGERERRSAGECCSYQNESSDCTSSSASSSSSSLAGYIRRKPWGDCKDPSSSSIRALLTDWRTGNAGSGRGSVSAEAGDLEASLPREPLVALPTGCRAAPCQSAPGDGREMVTTGDLIGSGSAPAEPVDGVSVNNCYRAVPATVSAVPVIPCNNNVSNVRIVQTTRTFTSTEAQTDDVIVDAIRVPPGPSGVNPNREQRRRERRERRHQRRMVNHLHQTPDPAMWQAPLGEPMVDRLPDILNSHLPPPYTTLPLGLPPPQGHMHPPPPLPPTMPPPMAVPTVAGSSPAQHGGLRFPFAIVPAGRRRSRLSPHFTAEDEPKSCCGVAVSQTVSIRWFIVLIFLVGLCCAVVGTVLGAMKASGRDHLTVSLLMIGVGIVLVAVSAVAWRLTSQDAPSCRAMLGLGSDDSGGEPNRRFVPRLPPSYGRPHHPYAAMMYPEFQYRAPPPSYQASMQEYRLRLLLLDRHSGASPAPAAAVSPPPTYRSQAGSLLRAPIAFRSRDTLTPSQSEYSRPPSYRSRTSSRPDPPSSHSHSREPSGSDPGQAINVITVHPQHIIKLAPSPPLPAKNGKEHLVTIVQTAAEPSGPVIVTISGQQDMPSTTHCPESEMEILAHL